ncbi:MAG: hypothetical protein HW421_1974 [Ignavibacteria bacterium]|nr:hypothetical protein [Ignavibacteria bacterium]
MKNLTNFVLIATLVLVNLSVSKADTKQEIEKANKKGQIVFLVVTEKGNAQTQEALKLAQNAQKLYPESEVFELDRGNLSNTELIKKYRLTSVPIPLILVIASNGCVAGGAPSYNAKVEQLIMMVPSPREEEVLKAIYDGNTAFVVFSKKSDSKNKKQLDACQSACKNMDNKASTINVDIDDQKEKSFITKFNVDMKGTFPITYVVNAQGQVASMFTGIVESKSLVEAAKKKVSSGCCPPGSGKTCEPTKK